MTLAPWMSGGPSWLPEGRRQDPFGMTQPQIGGVAGLLKDPSFALALLANSRGQRFGQAVGNAGLQAQQIGQQREESELMRQYREAQMRALEQKQTPQGPASVQEYEYAKQNGYKGSFQDWITAGGQTSRPSAVQEWEFYSSLPEDKKPLYLEMKRTPPWKIETIEQVPTIVRGLPGGGSSTTPLSTLPGEAAAAQTIAGAKGVGQAVGEAQGAQTAKAPAKSSLDYVVTQFRAQIPKTQQGGLFGYKGKSASVTDKKDKERFENLREQLSTELRTVFRIPGEGTLSDQEQRQYGLQLPSTDYEPETNTQILDDLEARTQLRTETPIGASPAAGQKKRRYNPQTGRIE